MLILLVRMRNHPRALCLLLERSTIVSFPLYSCQYKSNAFINQSITVLLIRDFSFTVCRQWTVHEDEALALRLQKEESMSISLYIVVTVTYLVSQCPCRKCVLLVGDYTKLSVVFLMGSHTPLRRE